MSGVDVATESTPDEFGRLATTVDRTAIVESIKAFAEEFDRRLESFLTPTDSVPDTLQQAMRYSALAPGKRLRPFLVTRCCELVGGSRGHAWHVAAAVECVHAFSLIHDDLPAMDDDDLRRGRPTCHKAFDEAIAVLAGDALLALAFSILADHTTDATLVGSLVSELASGAGWCGMIGGQAADIEGETKPVSLDRARYIHDRKTAALFRSACRLGALIGLGTTDKVDALGRFGRAMGVSFQIADDLLDVDCSVEVLGKRTGKDAGAGKQSYPQCVGIDASRVAAREAACDALKQLQVFGTDADDLRHLAVCVADRNY